MCNFILFILVCRENAIRLEENEKREKELRNKIIEEAIDFKNAFYEKRKLQIDSKRDSNREKEKVKILVLCSDFALFILNFIFLYEIHMAYSSGAGVLG